MTAFTDQIETDRDATFLNAAELATEHVIDDVDVVCVVTSDLAAAGPAGMEAVWTDRTVLHVSTEAINRWPVGSRHVIDGEKLRVESLSEDLGMYAITLTRSRS